MDAIADRYERTYRRRPALAALRLTSATVALAQAHAAGDTARATELAHPIAALTAILDEAGRCRRCGRELRNPESQARRIGPECLDRAGGRP